MAYPSSSTISPVICAKAYTATKKVTNKKQKNLFTCMYLLKIKPVQRYT